MKRLRKQDVVGSTGGVQYEPFSTALRSWRQKLGCYSIFAAMPAIMAARAQDARANGTSGSDGDDKATTTRLPRLGRGDLRRGRNSRFDLVSFFTGGDNCPGRPIPDGSYTVAAPFIDTGDTSGANSTVSRVSYYYYFFYYNVKAADLIYSFTITSRGQAPEIRVTPNSTTYDPTIYLVSERYRGGCPAGALESSTHSFFLTNSASAGGAEVIGSNTLGYLPLNVPTYLFVDSQMSTGAASSGPYTLRIRDLGIASGPRKKFDYEADAKADISVFRPSNATWYIKRSSGGVSGTQFGTSTDKAVPADYDGDGKTDLAVFRPSEGRWYILNSSTQSPSVVQWGTSTDIPVPADYDGDGKADIAIFRPADGKWWINRSSDGIVVAPWGQNGDIPALGDYDGDGKSDLAVFRPSNGTWYISQSTSGFRGFVWGLSTDKIVPADYNGDDKTEIAVYRPSEGRWYIYFLNVFDPRFAVRTELFGAPGDIPVPADYDGNGTADIGIFRPSDGRWWVAGVLIEQFGQSGDVPTESAFGN